MAHALHLPRPRRGVEEIRDRAGFLALAPEWNALLAELDGPIMLRHEFIRCWIDHFQPDAPLRVLTLRDAGGRLEAVLPLLEERQPIYGVPMRQLVSPANVHSGRFDLIAREPAGAAAALLAHLLQDRDWDVLRLADVPDGGRALHLLDAAGWYGLPTGRWASVRSPYLPLAGAPGQLLPGLPAEFRGKLRRTRRRLAERGAVTHQRVVGGPGMVGQLWQGMLLEQSGWKGERGTAMAQSPRTRGFYTELARIAAGLGALSLDFLRLDGRAVAFQYCLEYGGRHHLLKPAYDENLRSLGLGHLLMQNVLEGCLERGVREYDFMGPAMAWKRRWTDQVRPHSWLFVFRNTPMNQLLCGTKFRWMPAARRRVNRWRG